MSPVHPANEKSEEKVRPDSARFRFDVSAAHEVTRRPGLLRVLAEPEEHDVDAELDIEADFRRKLAGLRRLSRHEKPLALKAAKEDRKAALKALKEKRAAARHARYVMKQAQRPTLG